MLFNKNSAYKYTLYALKLTEIDINSHKCVWEWWWIAERWKKYQMVSGTGAWFL